MKRRSFLGLSAATLSLALEPTLPGDERLKRALERARAAGKPLLAITGVSDEQAAAHNGRLFGQLMAFGSDLDLAALATCEVACISASELEVEPEAYLVLVEHDGTKRTLTREGDPNGEAVRRFLFPDEAAMRARYDLSIQAVGAEVYSGLDMGTGRKRPRLADVDRSAAMLYLTAYNQRDGATGQLWLERLAYAACLRLWERAPEGASWTDNPTPQPRPDPCPTCGMGFSPPAGRDFLDLYTR